MSKNEKKFKAYLRRRKNRVSVFGLAIPFDWTFIVVTRTLFVLVGLVLAIMLYKNISSGRIFNAEVEDTGSADKIEKIRTIENIANSL